MGAALVPEGPCTQISGYNHGAPNSLRYSVHTWCPRVRPRRLYPHIGLCSLILSCLGLGASETLEAIEAPGQSLALISGHSSSILTAACFWLLP